MAPTIILIPGYFEGPTVWKGVTSILQSQGYLVEVGSLLSTGQPSPGNPSMDDDIAHIRSTVSKAVEEAEQEALLVLHSGGGFLGAAAIEGLSAQARKASGKKGGVVKILFIVAGILALGDKPPLLPFVEFKDGAMSVPDARESFFHDLPEAEKDYWMGQMRCQPAADWDRELTYCGWMDVPSAYLVCEGDKLFPVEIQLHLAGMAGSEVLRCEDGHMVQLSNPEKVVEVIKGVLAGL